MFFIYFILKHVDLYNKSVEYLKTILRGLQSNRKAIKTFTSMNEKDSEAFYLFSLRITKTCNPPSIDITLILPVAKDIIF